jgi:hypothetical protein
MVQYVKRLIALASVVCGGKGETLRYAPDRSRWGATLAFPPVFLFSGISIAKGKNCL